jgi:Fe-Mn family superoxide dismutase
MASSIYNKSTEYLQTTFPLRFAVNSLKTGFSKHKTQPQPGGSMKFELPKLPFAPEALQPSISAETIQFHYGKHHKAYVDKTNALIEGTRFAEMSLEEIVMESEGDLYNNASQAWNHTFYWHCLTNNAGSTLPKGELLAAIIRDFGSFESFKKDFSDASKTLFGSGWAWLVKDPSGKLDILKMSNADSPVGHDSIPILTCDVWEHAYYIDYRNERPKYLDAFFKIANWDFASENFALEENPNMTVFMTSGSNSKPGLSTTASDKKEAPQAQSSR